MITYDPHKWMDHFFDIRGSLVKEIIGRVAACGVWATAVCFFHHFVRPVGLSPVIHTLVGTALGLLLVFRTNSSNDRYWEGRKLWGGIVNETRNMIRMATVYFKDQPDLLIDLTRWTALFPWAAMSTLREVLTLGPIEKTLRPEDVHYLKSSQHVGLAVATRMTRCVNEGRLRGTISDIQQFAMDQNTQQLIDFLGGCERIRKTPLPFAYVVHLRRALVLYCFTLPFPLLEPMGWLAIPGVIALSYVFFGVEEIGVEIEGPFGYDDNDLPLEQICQGIGRNVYSLAGLESGAPEKLPEGL